MMLSYLYTVRRGRKVTKFWRSSIALLLLGLAGPGLTGFSSAGFAASQYQTTQSIEEAVRSATQTRATQHGYEDVTVEVRRLDPRLRLNQCSQGLDANVPAGSAVLGAVSVAVSCQDDSPWTIYVRGHVSAMQEVPVLNKPLARNALITANDLNLIKQPMGQASSGTVFKVDQLVGMELIRSMDAGAALRLSYLRKPDVIKRGQQVTLVSGVKGLEVRISGKALADAADGERVAVSNLSSGKRVEGIAHSDGTVSVQ